ncbi:MAG TPA: histidine kinase dimerization/phosphoacceptor domain -containing protein [Bacteroidales bacterium]|nr:histidine kinase dimerization/phosphoacceptor domain -containing protein [Bacteroidales bacterium]HPS62541.1 histidine kinase dimerization/phosphoacceptor domain -containing protein [Bacteroidales bacterium]
MSWLRKYLPAVLFLFTFAVRETVVAQVPLYRRVADSLERIRPHETPEQKAILWLDIAEVIRGYEEFKSYHYLLSAFRVAIENNNNSLKAVCRLRLGDFHNQRRRYMQAHEQYFAAWQISRVAHDTIGEISALTAISMINRSLKNHEKALIYLQKARTLCEKRSTPEVEGRLNEQFAQVYQAMGDRETAHFFYNKALETYRQSGNRKKELRIRSDIGSLFIDEERWQDGLEYFYRLMGEMDTTDLEMIGILYTRMGHIYDRLHDHRKSLEFNLKALKYRLRDHAMPMINSSLINIAGDYYDLGMADSGRIYMDSGLIMAYRNDRLTLAENAYRHLYDYSMHKRDLKSALEYYGRYAIIHDAISLDRNRNNIAILEANQRLQRSRQSGILLERQHSIQSLNLRYHDNQRMILEILMALAGVSTLIFVVFSLYFRNERRKMQDINVRLSDEIREREAAEAQTRDREAQYKFITDNSIDLITHFDENRKWLYVSPSVETVYGYDLEVFLSLAPEDLIHPEDRSMVQKIYRESTIHRLPQRYIFRAIRKDQSVLWAESVLIPIYDPGTHAFKGMLGVTRDIQEIKTKELQIMEGTKQKENLLKEIHHRVKNNFAILVSLINMQMAQTSDKELLQSLTNLQLRIRTMALVHEMLYRSGDFEKISFPGYLRTLASVIAGTYNRRNIGLLFEADEVVMDIEMLIPLGLIVNEILSNAYKHAYPEGRTGNVSIRFTNDTTKGQYTLYISDDGIGLPEGTGPAHFKTMGLQVVQILCTQIEASLRVENNPGATFYITFRPKGA